MIKNLLMAAGLSFLALVLAAQGAEAVTLYATDRINVGLYTIDTDGFGVSLVGWYGVGEDFIGGLEFDSEGALYGISVGSEATLYILDPATAMTTMVGALNVGFVFEGGLAFDPTDGQLYGVNQGLAVQPHLIRIDKTSGQGTVIGEIAGAPHDFQGLVFDDDGQLYGLDGLSKALWTIDKIDPSGPGTARVGEGLGSGIAMGSFGGMTRDPATGTVYGYGAGHQLFTVDLTTGNGTVLHRFGPGVPEFRSLAFFLGGPTALEPATWGAIKASFR
jgi:hypothetical protein